MLMFLCSSALSVLQLAKINQWSPMQVQLATILDLFLLQVLSKKFPTSCSQRFRNHGTRAKIYYFGYCKELSRLCT